MTPSTSSATRPKPPGPPSLLRDQLAQFNGPASSSPGVGLSGRSILGWFLALCGIAASTWLVFIIHGAIFRPEKLGMPLRHFKPEDLAMLIPSGKVELPPIAVTLVGYLLVVMLLAIAAKLAVAMLKLGTSLLLDPKKADDLPKLDN